MLWKDAEMHWTEDCQKDFDKIKEYLSTPPVLVPPKPGRPSLLYLSVLDGAFGCVLGQHDETGRKEKAIYYLSKKFTPYEKAVKGQALADHLAENLVGGEYEPLKTYFPDEEGSFVGEDITEAYDDWRMFFDGATNFKRVGIRAVLEASRLLEEIHARTYGPHMNGFVLAKKILRVGYFWMTMETNCIWFILVAIDSFTKWVEAASYKAVTKKVIADFVKDLTICRFRVPESIITDNVANLNSDLMKAMRKTFKRKHKNSITYRPQINGDMEAANKNIKKILRKIEAELSDAEWIRSRYEQLALIDRKKMNAVCPGQIYQNRISRAFNKSVKPRQFAPGQLVLKKIFPHQNEAKGKFSSN
ncbi:uncharacterized protein [Nicotiana sylvestris]|uniref:uncharacterized protein n=1 Tax=Nicotiana sylvestris TaxID=4096 RepID=UPI00388C8CE2